MIKAYFKENTIDLRVPLTGDIRKTLTEITYISEKYDKIKVETGLYTDLGSIPQVLQNIFPKDGKAMFAYILHDHLYKSGVFSRSASDDILEEAMEVLGVGYFKRKSVRLGLKLGGWVAWNKHRKKDNR